MKKIFAVIGVIVLGILIGWVSRGRFAPRVDVVTQCDTLIVRDTIVKRNPVYLTRTVTDTMLVPVRDTVTLHDTTFITITREQRHYKEENYEAWVSGYRPQLDSLSVFPETRYITKTVSVPSRKRWGIGLQAGYGVGFSGGKLVGVPYIGVGISYNLLCF